MQHFIDTLASVLEALAEPARLRLLALCQHGELTVKELTEATGMSQPRVSRHLRILVEAGVLQRFREAHWVYYRLPFEGDGAGLARQVLERASAADPVLQADTRRLDAVLAARARELRAAAGGDPEAVLTAVPWQSVEQSLQRLACEAAGADGLGELLDIGTGSGRMLRLLGPHARHAEGVDLSRAMRVAARTALREAGLAHCTVREADMYRLPFGDGHFDTVAFGHVLTCAQEPWRAIEEAVRVLRVGGHLLVMDLLPEGMPVEAWIQSLSDWLAGAGLSRVAEEKMTLPGATAVVSVNRREVLALQTGLAETG